MKKFNFLSNLWSLVADSQRNDVEFDRRFTVGSPSVRCVSTNSARTAREGLKYAAMLVLLFTLAVGQMWGAVTSTYIFSTDDNSKTITNNGVQWGLGASSVATNGTSLYLGGTITITMPTGAYLYSAKINKSSNWAAANKVTVLLKSGSTTLQTFSVSNYSSAYVLSGNQTDGSYTIEKGLTSKNAWITSIQLVYYPQTVITLNANGGAANKSAKYNYSSGTAAAFTACTRDGYTCTGYYTASSSGTKILNADGTLAAASISSYTDSGKKWIYDGAALTLYAQWESAASCTATPSIGAASLNGSFNLSSVGVSCASSGAGTNCSITEYGWVWSDGTNNTNPLIDGSNVTNSPKTSGAPSGSGGSFTGTLSGLFTVDHTYYYKAYVTNGKPATTYSSVQTFTPRSITFNSNGGSSVSTIYLNSGTAASAPTAPTKSGSVFAGWYSNEGLTSAVDWSANITSSKTYYAKWYTVTVNVKDEAGNSLSGTGKPTASCSGTTLSTSAGSEKYVFKEWEVSNTAALGSSKTTASNSLTSITGNVTVTAIYHAPITLTKGTNTGASTFNFSSNPIGYGETLTITCAADASHKGNPTVTASGTHGTISVVSATSVTIANVQSAMTVNISYTAKEAAVVKLHVAGSTSTISGTRYEGDSYTLPSEATECPDLELYGWYKGTYSHATTAPSGANFYLPGASATLTAGDNVFYAVYGTVTPDAANTYTKITSTSELVTGDYLLVAYFSASYIEAMQNTVNASGYMNEVNLKENVDNTTTPTKVTLASDNSAIRWRITKSTSTITIYNAAVTKYFCGSTGTPALNTTSEDFSYSVSSGDWTLVTNSKTVYYSNQWYVGTPSSAKPIYLFKRDASIAGPYTTSPSCVTHTLDVEVTPDGKGTATAGKTVLGESKTTTVTASPIENYSFAYWTISGTGSTMSNTSDGKSTDNPVTVTMGTDDATITAHFTENPYHYATFKNDLKEITDYEKVKVYDGNRPTPPTLTDGDDACDKTECTLFYGWIADGDEWEDTEDDISDYTIYRSASSLPVVSGADVTYHAVWAKGTAAPTINSTLIAKWDKQALTAGTAVKAKDKDGNTLNGTTLTISNLSLNSDAIYCYSKAASIGAYPVITISGLDFSAYSSGVITFFARGSQNAKLTAEYSTNDGVSFSDLDWEDYAGGKEYGFIIDVPNTTTDVRISYASNTGNFYFGTVRAYGENSSTSYTFEELTSSNTSGWSGSDWDGYYLITATKDTKTYALRSDVMEGLYGYAEVSPSEGSINTYDLGMVFKVTYNSSTSKYAIQSAATLDYLTDDPAGVSEKYHLLETSATEAISIAYNQITHTTSYYVQWNSDRFGSYTSSTAPTLYKILSSYSKWRISCCEKKDITKTGSGTVTGGTFTVDKTSACEGATVTLSVTSTSSGYNFDHWEVTGDDSDDEITVTDNQFTMPNEAVTATAVFETAHTTTVTLNKQGGTSGTSSVTATVNLPMPAATMPTKTGYTFGGYYSATNGSGTQYYDADGNSSHVWDDSENDAATLYAKWTSSGYTVTLNTEGGSGGTASVTVYYGVNTNLTSAITCPTKANNVFGGYFTSAGGAGTQLIDADGNWLPSVTSYTDVTKQWLYANDLELHAKWTSVSYTNYRTTCGPEIELEGGPVYLTSYANCEVLTPSTGLITVSSNAWGSTAVSPKFLKFTLKDKNGGTTYSHTSSNIASSEFRVYNADGNGSSYADGSYFAIPIGTTGAATYNFRIAYKPAASVYNTLDHYVLEVEVMDNSTPTKKAITMETMDLYGRTLPEQFVIAVKKDGQWYALPNDLASTAETAKATAAIPIVVDNATTPTSAVFAPENVLYKGTQYYDGPAVANRNRSGIRFTRNGSQYLQVSTTPANNNMWLSSTGGTDVQDWYLNSSTFGAYEVKIDPRVGSGGYKDKKIGMYGSNFGFYSSPTASDIYFLPVIGVLEEASVTEWGKNSVILEVDARSYSKVIARVGDVATGTLAFSETQSSKGNTSKYNYSINLGNTIDLTTKKGQLLYFDWINAEGNVSGSSMVTIPWLIAGEGGTMSTIDGTKGHWETEVHVLPGATLTADAGTFSGVTIKHLEIYPGATVKVTTGTLTASTLVLRNGWTRAVSKSYDVARLYIDGSASMTKPTNAFADWYIDYDQYYPIAVPWTVTTSGMSYKNSNSAASAGVKMRYYDGQSRADNGQSGVGSGTNWKEYSPLPTTLKPGRGYAMTAKRPTGKAFSIVRMPLTIPSADWTTGGEKGEVSSTHKDTVSVKAYGVSDESKPRYTVGWNFIANPYMSIYQGPITHSEGSYYDIEYVNIPDTEFKEYAQYPVGTDQRKLLPASGFLIQTDQDGVLTFGTTNRQASAPSYRNESTIVTYSKQKAYIVLTDEQTEDMMGILVSEKYTADYELNADLEKLLSDGNTLRTYMRYNDMNMAYLAINEELAKQLIPVSVRIPADGEYTFRIHEASIADELEGIYLTDYQTNTVTNLLYDSYTFNAVAGTDNVRFAINAVIGKREVPTGVDISDSNKDMPTKFIWNDKVYILHNNVIYDSTGKRVNVINK